MSDVEAEDTTPTTSDAAVFAEIAMAATQPVRIDRDADGRTAIVLPQSARLEVIDPLADRDLLDRPRRQRGTHTFRSIDSYIDWLNDARHAPLIGSPSIYVSKTGTMTAVLNESTDGGLGWGDYRAVFTPEFATEWAAWTEHDGELVSQDDFINFVETWAGTFTDPASGRMLDLVSTFEAFQSVQFRRAVRTQDGQVQFQYSETIEARESAGAVEIPQSITARVQVFELTDPVQITARFRYRLAQGRVVFGFLIDRVDLVLEGAIANLVRRVEGDTDIAVFHGSAPQS